MVGDTCHGHLGGRLAARGSGFLLFTDCWVCCVAASREASNGVVRVRRRAGDSVGGACLQPQPFITNAVVLPALCPFVARPCSRLRVPKLLAGMRCGHVCLQQAARPGIACPHACRRVQYACNHAVASAICLQACLYVVGAVCLQARLRLPGRRL